MAKLSSITPFICTTALHSTTNNDFFFFKVKIESYSIYLIFKPGMKVAFWHVFFA